MEKKARTTRVGFGDLFIAISANLIKSKNRNKLLFSTYSNWVYPRF
jgi:hypothetical protein